MTQAMKIEFVVRSGREVDIRSPELDDLCDEDGNLIIEGPGDQDLMLRNWARDIRVPPKAAHKGQVQ